MRVQILGLLEDGVASPSELAEKLNAPLGSVSYHVRSLASLNLIRLVSETPSRGSMEHHYTAVALPIITEEAWREVPEIVKNALVSAALEQAAATISAAAHIGGFSRPEAHLSRTHLRLDAEGWRTLADETHRWMQRVEELGREAAERLAHSEQPSEHATMLMMFFESPPDTQQGLTDAADHHHLTAQPHCTSDTRAPDRHAHTAQIDAHRVSLERGEQPARDLTALANANEYTRRRRS